MKLYWLPAENRYVHRLSDIPKGADSEVHEIGTDLASLMGRLNTLHAKIVWEPSMASELEDKAFQRGVDSVKCPEAVLESTEFIPSIARDMNATAVLSRSDNAGIDVDGVVEAIGKFKPYALKRAAGAVAMRFQELGKNL